MQIRSGYQRKRRLRRRNPLVVVVKRMGMRVVRDKKKYSRKRKYVEW